MNHPLHQLASASCPGSKAQQRLQAEDVTSFLLKGGLGLGVKPHKCSGAITRDYEGRPSEILEHAERNVLSSSSIARGGVGYWSYWTVWRLYDGLHPAESGQKKLA